MLSPRSQALAASVIRQLAEGEGISVPDGPEPGLQSPEEGIPLWVAKLRQEGYSRRTLDLYVPTARGYLRMDPAPTKLSIQRWLADRLDRVSTSRVSNDRKALRSLFSFLHGEGLWPTDPTAGLKAIRVRYRAREVPSEEDLARLMRYECHRKPDTQKFRTMLVLLMTTGLRVSEAAGALRENVDFGLHELKVLGKGTGGGKEGVVPLLPVTEQVLAEYMRSHQNGSPYIFGGDTELGYWSVSSFEKTLKRACAKLGVRKITPHQLRHFFATYSLRRGAKIEVVSRILRHSSVAITLDIYRHVAAGELHETAERFAPLNGRALTVQSTGSQRVLV